MPTFNATSTTSYHSFLNAVAAPSQPAAVEMNPNIFTDGNRRESAELRHRLELQAQALRQERDVIRCLPAPRADDSFAREQLILNELENLRNAIAACMLPQENTGTPDYANYLRRYYAGVRDLIDRLNRANVAHLYQAEIEFAEFILRTLSNAVPRLEAQRAAAQEEARPRTRSTTLDPFKCYRHDYRPAWKFRNELTVKNRRRTAKNPGKKKDVPVAVAQSYFGIELEINCEPEARGQLMSIAKNHLPVNGYLWKEDGSICPGMELVIAPSNYNEMRKAGLRKFCDEAKKAGFRSFQSGRCGLHIHYSTPSMGTRGSGPRARLEERLQAFVLSSKKEIVVFSGRNIQAMGYCWIPQASSRESLKLKPTSREHKNLKHDNHWQERYCAINFRNDATIEFRVFRGTLHYPRIIASIQFVEATMLFCGLAGGTPVVSAAILRSDRCWGEFCKFIDSKGQFLQLVKYLKSKRIYSA